MKADELYKMKLHEIKGFALSGTECVEILAVIGGWIYSFNFHDNEGNQLRSSCFVPAPNTAQVDFLDDMEMDRL